MSHSLANALRINEYMIPKIHNLIMEACSNAEISKDIHAFVYASHEVQASVSQEPNGSVLLAISSSAVRMLTHEELSFVIGHEMGHVAYEHIGMPVHLVPDEPSEEFLELQRAAEISADRVGYLQVKSLDVAVSAMAKMASGLDAQHLDFHPLLSYSRFATSKCTLPLGWRTQRIPHYLFEHERWLAWLPPA